MEKQFVLRGGKGGGGGCRGLMVQRMLDYALPASLLSAMAAF